MLALHDLLGELPENLLYFVSQILHALDIFHLELATEMLFLPLDS